MWNMSIPIISSITTEKITNSNPTIAAVRISRDCCIFSGFDWDVMSLSPEYIMRSIAIPPENPRRIPNRLPTNPVPLSPRLTDPIPVLILRQFPLLSRVHGGEGGPGVAVGSGGGVVPTGTSTHLGGVWSCSQNPLQH